MLVVVSHKNWSRSRELQHWKLFASFFVVIIVGWFPTKMGLLFSGLCLKAVEHGKLRRISSSQHGTVI